MVGGAPRCQAQGRAGGRGEHGAPPPQPPGVTEGPGTGLEDWQVDMCAPGQTQVGRCVLPSIVLARALVSHNSVNVSYRKQVTEASFYHKIQLKCQKVISRIIVAYTF